MFDDEDEPIRDYASMPIYHKGKEIYDITRNLIELIPEDAPTGLKEVGGQMMLDASFLTVKIAGAEGADLFDIRMENAALIRKAARELVVNTHGLEMFGFKETHYFQVLRDAVEEYRVLFVEWVNGFDQWNYIIDRWGLFNPPGVNADDVDPDDLG
jgi:hypothetical protein